MRVLALLVVAVAFAAGCSDREKGRDTSKPVRREAGRSKPDPDKVTVSARFDGRVYVTGPARLSREQILRIAETSDEFLAWRKTKIVYQAATASGAGTVDPVVELGPGQGRLYVTMPSNMTVEAVNRVIVTNDVYRGWLGNYLILDRDS